MLLCSILICDSDDMQRQVIIIPDDMQRQFVIKYEDMQRQFVIKLSVIDDMQQTCP